MDTEHEPLGPLFTEALNDETTVADVHVVSRYHFGDYLYEVVLNRLPSTLYTRTVQLDPSSGWESDGWKKIGSSGLSATSPILVELATKRFKQDLSVSNLTFHDLDEALTDLDISIETAQTRFESVPHGHDWTPDGSAGDAITRGVGENFLQKERLWVVEIEPDQVDFVTAVPGFSIAFRGNIANVLILGAAQDKGPRGLAFVPYAPVAIQVQQVDGNTENHQSIAQLIALDYAVWDLVLVLSTNLKDKWTFYWVDQKNERGLSTIKSVNVPRPAEAFELIRTAVGRSMMAKFELPWLEKPVRRAKLYDTVYQY